MANQREKPQALRLPKKKIKTHKRRKAKTLLRKITPKNKKGSQLNRNKSDTKKALKEEGDEGDHERKKRKGVTVGMTGPL